MAINWIKEGLWQRLNCLVPVYGTGDDCGNYTEVWLDDGTKILDRRRTKTVLKSLAAHLGVSWRQEQTAWSQGRSHAFPVVLGPEMVLVPLRLRRPRSRDEGGTGYVVGGKVRGFEAYREGCYRTRLFLAGNQVLPCLLKMDTLALRLAEGEQALLRRRELAERLTAAGTICRERDGYCLVIEPGGKTVPARLIDRGGDIIILRREVSSSSL
ncbi:hypothetical protein [Neomoorella humiferrea]|uniref:Uncharacterized protein n=1 Tax=Neomoorella humiferrea TaxID=676965 RepID=A0A2T0AQE9_9FIRM|nr:hypothetical protein [Moorella humiferrea]PRR71331.1 hypothetical protein MOHU_16430 [Moorella humiferrea]